MAATALSPSESRRVAPGGLGETGRGAFAPSDDLGENAAEVELVERSPTPDEYVTLRSGVGWPSPSTGECARALRGSLGAVCAVHDGQVIGMGRLVGDGAMYCFVVDVVVDPYHQGRGVGRAINERLESMATVGRFGQRLDLVAAAPVVPFYQRLGYSRLESDLMRKPL